jgi:hypothetical protein
MTLKRDDVAVTEKQKANLKPIKKGEVRNPEGSRSHNPAVKALKKLTLETYREVIELVLTGNLASLKALAENPDTPAIQVGVATAFMKAITAGDYNVIEQIASRIVGKIPDEINVNSKNVNANLNASIDKEKLKKALIDLENDV